MSDTVLITLGCSWTFGEGSGYKEGMTLKQYEQIQHDENICWENGWRKPVVEHFGFDHINIAEGGSSNDRQFRLAKQFFVSKKFTELYQSNKRIIVVWGTTSLNRYDMWLKENNRYEKLFLQNIDTDMIRFGGPMEHLSFAIDRYSYYEPARVKELELEFLFWNRYFKLLGIKNFWFDTFSSYKYSITLPNFFDGDKKNNRDLVSVIADNHKKKVNFKSLFPVDNFQYALDNDLLNKYSFHPKKDGYKVLAEYFIDKLKEHI